MQETFVNKVAESGLITLNLEEYLPDTHQIVSFDIKPYLFMELILKEKDFRAALQSTDWSQYADKYVAIHCSTDAIIPMWAYMLITAYLQPVAKDVFFGTEAQYAQLLLDQAINNINVDEFADKRVVIKGCGEKPIPESAYVKVTFLLRGIVKSIMYGEPCSTVPIYKKKA